MPVWKLPNATIGRFHNLSDDSRRRNFTFGDLRELNSHPVMWIGRKEFANIPFPSTDKVADSHRPVVVKMNQNCQMESPAYQQRVGDVESSERVAQKNYCGLCVRQLQPKQPQVEAERKYPQDPGAREAKQLPPNPYIAMANAQLLARAKRGILTMKGVARKDLRILPSTYELMRTFRGRWRRKSRDAVNDIQMHPLDEYAEIESTMEMLFFRRILHYELMRDDSLILEYNSNCLSMSELTPSMRATLFNWLIRVQEYYKFPSEALHVATTLVDRFTWRRMTRPEKYQLVGVAAVVLGVKLTTRKPSPSLEDLCYLTENTYSTEEVQYKEEKMLKTFGYNLIYPIPHTFIGFSLIGFEDLPEDVDARVIILLCRYIFDQGLTELSLAQYAASLKCAATMYLIRHLLRLICQCPLGDLTNCPFHSISRWTDKMAGVTGHRETTALKRVAFTYGLMLIEAQFFLNETTPGLMTGCGSSLRAAFKKYSRDNSLRIARHPLVKNFTIADILHLDTT